MVCIGFGMAAGAAVLKHLVDKSHQTKALVLTRCAAVGDLAAGRR